VVHRDIRTWSLEPLVKLLLALAFAAAPFGVMYGIVLHGHMSANVNTWWRMILSVVCFFWLLYGIYLVVMAIADCFLD
jgi:hypothetical protein